MQVLLCFYRTWETLDSVQKIHNLVGLGYQPTVKQLSPRAHITGSVHERLSSLNTRDISCGLPTRDGAEISNLYYLNSSLVVLVGEEHYHDDYQWYV